MNGLLHRPSLQSIAAKCTKVGNEQPSEQPLENLGGFSFEEPACLHSNSSNMMAV
jgi:hypothetical protein